MTDDRITIYFSITSRYAYLASTQMDRLAADTGCEIVWAPVDASELRRLADSEPLGEQSVSGQYRSPYREQDLADWVAFYDVPYREPPEDDGALWWKGFGWDKMRMLSRATLVGLEHGAGPEYVHALFHLMFVGDTWPFGMTEVATVAADHGISGETFAAAMAADATDAALTANAHAAKAAGAFGVPSFVYQGKMFFGNDRLGLLTHHIIQSR